MKGKDGIIKGIITLIIGGTVFSVSQADIVRNFSKDAGISKEEAEQYIENITEDDLVPYDELGSDLVSDGQDLLKVASDIDCDNYEYEWETATLTCSEGKSQLVKIGNTEIALGKAYIVLSSETASIEDISLVIKLIEKYNADLNLGVVTQMLDYPMIEEAKKTNSYNKAVLQAALDSK